MPLALAQWLKSIGLTGPCVERAHGVVLCLKQLFLTYLRSLTWPSAYKHARDKSAVSLSREQ